MVFAVVVFGFGCSRPPREPEAAVAYWTARISRRPSDAAAHVQRALAYRSHRPRFPYTDSIIANLSAALRLDSSSAETFYLRGAEYHYKTMNVVPWADTAAIRVLSDSAYADYSRAIGLKPDYVEAYEARGRLSLRRNLVDAAVADFTVVVRLRPRDPRSYDERAKAYAARDEWPGALADYDEMVRLRPDSAAVYVQRGWAYESAGDDEHALADYATAMRVDPTAANPYRMRAEFYARRAVASGDRQDLARALADYSAGLAQDTAGATAGPSWWRTRRGDAYLAMAQLDSALAEYTAAIERDTTWAVVYYQRGLAYRQKGLRRQAVADFTRVVALTRQWGEDSLILSLLPDAQAQLRALGVR